MIFTSTQFSKSPQKGNYNQCILEDGKCMAFFQSYVGLYKSALMVDNPLGNGLLCLLELPDAMQSEWNNKTGYIAKVQGGCIILNSQAIVLLKPNTIELYSNGLDALHGRNSLSVVDIPATSE